MSSSVNEKVMVAGHISFDITPTFPSNAELNINDVFMPGKLSNVGSAVLSTGGSVSNTGLVMAKLSADVLLNGKIGEDVFGDIIRQRVGTERAAALKTVPGEDTSYTVVLTLPGVDRMFLHNTGANDSFVADDIDYDLAKKCVLFHFGYPPLMRKMYENDGAELVEMYRRIKELGVTTSLDMAAVDPANASAEADWQKILEKVLPFVDIFLPSIEEIAFMIDREMFEERKAESAGKDPVCAYKSKDCCDISTKLLDMGVKIAGIKCGIRGLYLRTSDANKVALTGMAAPKQPDLWGDREIWAPSFKTDNFKSALGAGDATIAGFLCSFIRGFSPEDSLKIANTIGWQNVQAVDTLTGIKDWQSVLELIKNNSREQNPVELDSSGWSYCSERQLYFGPHDNG